MTNADASRFLNDWLCTMSNAEVNNAVSFAAVTDRSYADLAYTKELNSKMAALIDQYTKAEILALASAGEIDLTEEQVNAWYFGLRGAYNPRDMNRVGYGVNFLAPILRQLPIELRDYAAEMGVAFDSDYDVPYDPADYNITGKIDYDIGDEPNSPELAAYLAKVALLRAALDYNTPALPDSMGQLNYTGANNIEEALQGLDRAIIAFRAATKQNIDRAANSWYYSGEVFAGEVYA